MTDDYKSEILLRLSNSLLYQSLRLKCLDNDADADVLATVHEGVGFAYQRTKAILRHMGEFTLHDGDHLFHVLYLMELILTKQNISKLSIPELMLLILSAFFHDIGMAPSEREVETWMKIWNKNIPEFCNEEELQTFSNFQRFLLTKVDEVAEIKELFESGNFTRCDTMKGYLVTDYIRQSHADRARLIIDKEKILGENRTNRVWFRENDLTVDLADICYSHNEDAISLLDLDKNKVCGQEIYACLPLIGVLLRLADVIDFDAKRTPAILFSHLNIKHPISLLEWKKHRAVENWDIHPEIIQFSARCDHPAIEASIREYCDTIDAELSVCNNILSSLSDFSKFSSRGINLKVPLRVTRDKIEATRNLYDKPTYIYRDTKFTLSKRQVIDLLMGTKLYGNPEVALRELLQNSLDACLLRKALEKEWKNEYIPLINVKLCEVGSHQILQVEDNGIGMDQDIIDKYYTKVGASFYKSADFNNLRVATNAELKPTSRFGIGILSTFMVADSLIVDTKKIYGPQDSSPSLNLTAEGHDSIFWIKPGDRKTVGTTTKLILRKGKNPWDKMSDDQFVKSVKVTIPNPPFPIIIKAGNKEIVQDEKSFVNTRPSIPGPSWTKEENLKLIEFGVKGYGITGSCVVAILEQNSKPTSDLTLEGKIVEVEGRKFPLSKFFKMADNQISITSTTIGTDSKGEIVTDKTTDFRIKSGSVVSLHGIEVPADLFPESWRERKNQVKITWPFPIHMVVDVGSPMDLDVNSARSEILNTDKWIEFEEKISFLVTFGIKSKVGKRYWENFKKDIIITSGNKALIKGIELIENADVGSELPKIFNLPKALVDVEDPINNLPF